jgi:hypothetical protein
MIVKRISETLQKHATRIFIYGKKFTSKLELILIIIIFFIIASTYSEDSVNGRNRSSTLSSIVRIVKVYIKYRSLHHCT